MDYMTANEKKVVEELKRRTINDVTPKMLEDVSLFYRFAKARDYNIEEAENMLRKHIAWRKDFKIDSILTDYEPPEALVKYFISTFICFDKHGGTVRHQDCGRADLKGLFSMAGKKDLAKYCVFLIEQDMQNVIKRGGNLGKPMYTPIDNFENSTYANAISVNIINSTLYLIKIYIDNYPELLKTVYIINAPFYFSWFFSALKPIIPPAVIQKVRIFGSDGWKEALLKEIDADDLPAFLGGNRTDPDGNPLCETFIKRGQPIPKKYYLQNRTKKLILEPDVKKITVKPLSKEEITFEVKEEDMYLEWEFETKTRDIDFSLHFREESLDDLEPVLFIPNQRFNTCDEPEKGFFKCEKLGIYTIVFDNSYSWLHSKEVYYRANLVSRKNTEVYDSI